MPSIRQTHFGAGELDPLLHGRTDLPIFSKGLRRAKDFFVDKDSGALVSRAGTEFLAEVQGLGANTRLMPFVLSDTESFVLVWTNDAVPPGGATVSELRVFQDGEPVDLLPASAPGTFAIDLLDPTYFGFFGPDGEMYSLSGAGQMRYCQSGDVLFLTAPGKAPYQLRRGADGDWALTPVSFAPRLPWFYDLDTPGVISTTAPMLDNTTFVAADADHPEQEWAWYVSVVFQDPESGAILESLAERVTLEFDGTSTLAADHDPLTLETFVLYPDRAIRLRRVATTVPPLVAGFPGGWVGSEYTAIAHKYYRGRGDLIGLIGTTKSREFVDIGAEPDYLKPPLLGEHPFRVYDNDGNPSLFNAPTAVAFFQERLCWGGGETGNEPPDDVAQTAGRIKTSAFGAYDVYDTHIFPHAKSPLTYELAFRRREQIKHFLQLDALLAFTGATVWSVKGQETNPLGPESVDARVISEVGCARVPPLSVDGIALYGRAKGIGIQALAPSQGGWTLDDASGHAKHLFKGRGRALRDWTFAEDPHGLVWAVREDGALLSFTFSKSGVKAWCRHETDGIVHSVCAVPENGEDVLYLVVTRQLGGGDFVCLERMKSRVQNSILNSDDPDDNVDDPTDDWAVDCGFEVTQAAAAVVAIQSPGLSHLIGRDDVWVIAVGNNPRGPFNVEDAGGDGLVTMDEPLLANDPDGADLVTLRVGLKYTPQMETLDLVTSDTRMKPRIVEKAGVELDQSTGVYVGATFGTLKTSRPDNVASGYTAPERTTVVVPVNIPDAWSLSGKVCLEMRLPLPVTIEGIVREVKVGD